MKLAKEFWSMVRERELIFARRWRGLPRELWTRDEIFASYSFTNVKRHRDRVTRGLLDLYYLDHQRRRGLCHPDPVALINAARFRYTGTIGAARALGWVDDWSDVLRERFESTAEVAETLDQEFWTGAYVIPNAGSTAPKRVVVGQILDQIWAKRDWILDVGEWREAAWRMGRCWGVGSFMAKEVLLDYVLMTGWSPIDWQSWTPVGPGACRGAAIVRDDPEFEPSRLREAEALQVCLDLYDQRANEWPSELTGDHLSSPWRTEPLDLTDIQFQLCEFCKYWKTRKRWGRPRRLFRPTVDGVTRGS